MRVVLALSAILATEVSSAVTWSLGGVGQSCTAYCNQINQACTPGHWPSDAFQLLRVAIASDQTKCTNVKVSTDEHAPSVRGVATGVTDCEYNLEVSSQSSCAKVPPSGEQRFCPCSPSGLRWYLGTEGQSCRDTCRVRGGVCGDEASVWPETQDALETVVSYIGHECTTKRPGEASFNPSVGADGTCYYGSAANSKKAFCDAADWTNSNQRRICPCWDVE